MTEVILFPSSFPNPREVDEDLAEEYRAARLVRFEHIQGIQ